MEGDRSGQAVERKELVPTRPARWPTDVKKQARAPLPGRALASYASGGCPACAASGAECLHPCRQPRDLAARGVLVEDAPAHAAHDLRLCGAQLLLRGRGVARGDRFLDLADEGADTRAARLVHGRAAQGLARAFAG